MKTEWQVDKPAKCYDECSHIKEQDKHGIVFSRDLWHVIKAMLHRFPEHEWQMMLTGTIDRDVCHCTGYYITKQRVSGGLVTNIDCVDKELIDNLHIVAGIHSHVNMPVSPSGTDINDSVMSLIDYHVIVNNRLNTNGMRKVRLPCGGISIASCSVKVADERELDTLVIEGIDRIEKEAYVTQLYGSVGAQYRQYTDDYDADVIKHMQEMGHGGYGC